jgi:hypothetical protein
LISKVAQNFSGYTFMNVLPFIINLILEII